uniref:TIR domain-containing protein n=1 Tax=Octopus bimaculoides TaxID=37653 RepID=A0A0L8H9I5_OCTBM
MTSNEYDFFLHFSKEDYETAEEVLHILEQEYPHRKLKGYICDRDFDCIGSKFELDEVIKDIDIIFVIFSQNSERDKEFMYMNSLIMKIHLENEETKKTIPIYIDEDVVDKCIFKTLQGINYNSKNFLSKMKTIFR